jgi:hypothetical protein
VAATGFSSRDEIAIDGFPITRHTEVGPYGVKLPGNGLTRDAAIRTSLFIGDFERGVVGSATSAAPCGSFSDSRRSPGREVYLP